MPRGLAILSPSEQVRVEWFRHPLLPKRTPPIGGPFRGRFVTWRTCTEASCPRPKSRPVARSARFLVIDPKVRIVCEEIELVAEAFDHRATHVAGIRQSVVVKGFVEHWERPVLRLESS